MKWSMPATTLFIASLGIVSCKDSTPVASSVKSSGFSCDLQSSAAASNDASQRAFKCAYNSLKTAGKLAGGGIVTDAANIVSGIKDVYDGAVEAGEIISDLREFVRNGGVLPVDDRTTGQKVQDVVDASKEQFEDTDLGKVTGRTAMYRCLSGNYDAVKSLISLAGLAQQTKGSDRISAAGLQNLASLGVDSVKFILDRMNTLSECTQWLQGKRSVSLVKLSKGVEKISSSIDVAVGVARCGVDLAYGGYVLYSNSACLAEDMQNYYESRERLDNQRDNFVNNTTINQDGESANQACMRKYGIHLYNNGPGEFYNSRSYMCALYCGNKGRGLNYMRANMDSIYPIAEDRQFCSRVANSSQDNESINSCIVFCCDQSGSCRDSAWEKLRYNDL